MTLLKKRSTLQSIPDGPFTIIISFLSCLYRFCLANSLAQTHARVLYLYEELQFDPCDVMVMRHLFLMNENLFLKLKNVYKTEHLTVLLRDSVNLDRWKILRQLYNEIGKDVIMYFSELHRVKISLICGDFEEAKLTLRLTYNEKIFPEVICTAMLMNNKRLARYLIRKYVKFFNSKHKGRLSLFKYNREEAGFSLYRTAVRHSNLPLLNLLYGMKVKCNFADDLIEERLNSYCCANVWNWFHDRFSGMRPSWIEPVSDKPFYDSY